MQHPIKTDFLWLKRCFKYLQDAFNLSLIIVEIRDFKFHPSEFTVPVGKKSQGANLADYNVLIADDGTAIATINNYKDGETLTL